MTKLVIDLSDVAGGTHPDDNVVVWSPVHREGSAGRTVSPTQHTIRLTEGVGELEVEPGPLMVQTHVRAIADTRPKEVVVPDQATVTLWDLLEQVFQWTPPLVNRSLQAIIDALEDALSQVSDAVGDEVDAIKWSKGLLASGESIDPLRGSSAVGVYPVRSSTPGTPKATNGWVQVTYNPSDVRTQQRFIPSSPIEHVEYKRVFSGGSWNGWRPVSWRGDTITSGTVDDYSTEGTYEVGSANVGGLPAGQIGNLEVLPAGTSTATVIQRYTVTSSSTPRLYIRSRFNSAWSAWERIPGAEEVAALESRIQAVEDGALTDSITFDRVQESSRYTSEIMYAMNSDRTVGWNGSSNQLRQSTDGGVTWVDARNFAGQSIEHVEPLDNGELLVATTATVDGVTSVRRVWLSEGYDPSNPKAATWSHKLTGQQRLVKFVDWSFYTHDNIALVAEYGPKGGMEWAAAGMINEGDNARYVHLSTDYGKTWTVAFDLNTWLVSVGQDTLRRHLHGVAWDPHWERIWLSFGDNMGGVGSNGVLFSDDMGDSWEIAYHSADVPDHAGWQVVGIQPMRDCVLFAGDMTPSGLMRLDRSGGKGRTTWEFVEAYDFGGSHLCHSIRHHDSSAGELALFAFSSEGGSHKSFIIGTRDGYQVDVLWEDSTARLPGIRWIAGPTPESELVAAVNTGSGWVEVRGQLSVPVDVDSMARQVEQMGTGKADKDHVHTASQITDLHHYSGVGFPEGKVTAPVGATYTDTAATNGAVRWVKTQGTGNTGWAVEYGDTGWRDITTQSDAATSGEIYIRRHGETISLVFDDVQLSSRSSWQSLVQIPSGFRTAIRIDHRPTVFTDVTTLISNYEVGQYRSTGHASSDDPLVFRDTWLTSDSWPTTLPGIPV